MTIGPLHSVEAVVKGLTQAAFDVVLIDIDLPGLPLDSMLAELERRAVPVILMSEHGHGPQGRAAPQAILLKKPLPSERLLEVVGGALARSGAGTG